MKPIGGMRERKSARAPEAEWIVRARSRTGPAGSVHYGSQVEIDWHARAARERGDEVEEHRLIFASPSGSQVL